MDGEKKGKRSDEVHGSCPVRQRGSLNWEGVWLGGYVHQVTKPTMSGSFFRLVWSISRLLGDGRNFPCWWLPEVRQVWVFPTLGSHGEKNCTFTLTQKYMYPATQVLKTVDLWAMLQSVSYSPGYRSSWVQYTHVHTSGVGRAFYSVRTL